MARLETNAALETDVARDPLAKFAKLLFIRDLLVVTLTMAVVTAVFISSLSTEFNSQTTGTLRLQLGGFSLAAVIYVMWVLALFAYKLWNPDIAGTGIPEYNQLIRASSSVVAVLAIAALTLKLDVSRVYVFSAAITGTCLLVLHRWVSRQWLVRQRSKGKYLKPTGVLGTMSQVVSILPSLRKNLSAALLPTTAYLVETDYTPTNIKKLQAQGLTVHQYSRKNFDAENTVEIDAILIFGSEFLTSDDVKRLTWAFEETEIEVILAPGLVNFADNRISYLNLEGLHLLRVQTPQFEGVKYTLKRLTDMIAGVVFALVASPVMVLTAALVKLQDGGPVLFKQQRIGQNGKPFVMFKFRSMRVGSELLHHDLKKTSNKSPNKILYKNPEDPRITRVGKFIRRWSIDELPQLLNVINGTMSLVGPRPPLPSEVEHYDPEAHRRLLVKPGITGLWQVSGRASLDWDTSVQLDIGYVENWSLIGDFLIILKTVKTIFSKSGAY